MFEIRNAPQLLDEAYGVQALLCLGQRWLKIIWKMWRSRTPYDPALHMRNQLAHGSWVLQIQPT